VTNPELRITDCDSQQMLSAIVEMSGTPGLAEHRLSGWAFVKNGHLSPEYSRHAKEECITVPPLQEC
jgi:hypothetical protein